MARAPRRLGRRRLLNPQCRRLGQRWLDGYLQNELCYATELINQQAPPQDLIAFTACGERNPASTYTVYRHYAPDSNRPVMFLRDASPSDTTLHDLAHRPHVWVVGASPDDDTGHFFPGWSHGDATILADGCFIWSLVPPAPTTR